jgi:hypothetical protein
MNKKIQPLNSKFSLHLKARDAMWFLESHPALENPIFNLLSLLDIQINLVCKRGYTEPVNGKVQVYWSKKYYKRFKKEFDLEFKEYSPEELKLKPLISIDIPYKDFYGEPWTPCRIEYWGDLSIVAFLGKEFKDETNRAKWWKLSGVEACGESFEEMMANAAKEFKKIYGNFTKEHFITAAEKKHNKGKKLFLFVRTTPTGSVMKRNPKYIHVSSAEINRRWWKWFSKTAYCKKNWSDTAKAILAGKDSF